MWHMRLHARKILLRLLSCESCGRTPGGTRTMHPCGSPCVASSPVPPLCVAPAAPGGRASTPPGGMAGVCELRFPFPLRLPRGGVPPVARRRFARRCCASLLSSPPAPRSTPAGRDTTTPHVGDGVVLCLRFRPALRARSSSGGVPWVRGRNHTGVGLTIDVVHTTLFRMSARRGAARCWNSRARDARGSVSARMPTRVKRCTVGATVASGCGGTGTLPRQHYTKNHTLQDPLAYAVLDFRWRRSVTCPWKFECRIFKTCSFIVRNFMVSMYPP